ncbi:MAG TPA: hypothetical protein VMX57_02495 [Planctomycetota bacterium]|nr:hypothetical protein [Planctomycetota bacterium]
MKKKVLKRTRLAGRRSLRHVREFAKLTSPGASAAKFLDSLPDVLAARALRDLAAAVVRARRAKRPVVFAFGAHVIKCGLAPVVIDLMKRGFITSLATHGASAIHDYEFAAAGHSSEDVAAGLAKGTYGMTRDTAAAIGEAAWQAVEKGCGLGRAVGDLIRQQKCKHRKTSIFAEAARLDIPCTVHVAIGTDTVHMHPEVDCGVLGAASQRDFEIVTEVVSKLNRGVWLNVGSAVILPEVFLKAVALNRSRRVKLDDVTTADLDMIRHYRPGVNVLGRPAKRSFAITGHHEIMLPLLRVAVLKAQKGKGGKTRA